MTIMTKGECLGTYGFHYLVPVDSGTDRLKVRVCIRCGSEQFEETDD